MNITALTAEESNNLNMDIGCVIVDVEQVTEENGVNPYVLKVTIEEGLNAEEASPFSSLATRIPNTQASDSAKYSLTKSAISTKVNKTDQDGTAYVAKSGALTTSGKTLTVCMCAMHINVITKTGNITSTKVKLGITIYMDKGIDVNHVGCSSFVIEDRGNLSNRTTYWINIYFWSIYHSQSINSNSLQLTKLLLLTPSQLCCGEFHSYKSLQTHLTISL